MSHYRTEYWGEMRSKPSTAIYCHQCDKMFDHPSGNRNHIQNMLKMHMQVHEPRTVSCPVCGDQRFRSTTNAVQHVESGSCRGCKGKENARQQIYKFISNKQESRALLAEAPALEWGGCGPGTVPDMPYKCHQCGRRYKQVSALMQHQQHGGRCAGGGQAAIGYGGRRS